jgi:HD-GYP domain-containing protein (c-di-GMP phosphodiesterase class II)
VSDFSVAIAEQLELPPEDIYRVRVGSMLHDVGKIGVDPQVLKKPGRLTDTEFQEMQRHPLYGVKLFQEAGLSELLAEELMALAQHHERLDGRGYPAGMKGEEISRMGRIVAVADTFDALTSDRPYRNALSVEEAFAILEKGAGTELDAQCVHALMQARAKGKIRVQHERDDYTYEE